MNLFKFIYGAVAFFSSAVILALLGVNSYGQGEASNWYFGLNAGYNFMSEQALVDGQIKQLEGCSTVSDSLGNLLFYTDGSTIWNKDHLIMTNGEGLNSSFSCSQSSLIVGFNNKFFVFTLARGRLDGGDGTVWYSIVDMTKQGGKGEVVDKNVLLPFFSDEKVTAVPHPNGQHIWVLFHDILGGEFISCQFSSQGLLSTVKTTVDKNFNFFAGGQLKASPDYRKIVSANQYGKYFYLFEFDSSTGKVSNQKIIPTTAESYGMEFSPDSKMLYVTEFFGVFQFDVSVLDSASIVDSRYQVNLVEEFGYSSLQLGPDKKIYSSIHESDYMGVINFPNKKREKCGFERKAVYLEGSSCQFGLPNCYVDYIKKAWWADFSYSQRCLELEFQNRSLVPIEGDVSYVWSFGDGTFSNLENPLHQYDNEGSYNVELKVTVNEKVTSYHYEDIVIGVPRDTTLEFSTCNASFRYNDIEYSSSGVYSQVSTNENGCDSLITLNLEFLANTSDTLAPIELCFGENYEMNGIEYSSSGMFVQRFTKSNGCDSLVYFEIRIANEMQFDLTTVGSRCYKNEGSVNVFHSGGGVFPFRYSLRGNVEQTDPYFIGLQSGDYYLIIKDSLGCEFDTTFQIVNENSKECNTEVYIPSSFSPDNDGYNDRFFPVIYSEQPIVSYTLEIFDRFGKQIFYSKDVFEAWDGTFQGVKVNTGVYPLKLTIENALLGEKEQTIFGKIILLR